MQQELGLGPIELSGINDLGSEVGNPEMCAGRTLPWLQDTADEQVWNRWTVTYRDVVILDRNNVSVAVYNLTDHDLGNPANYAELKALLQSIAAAP